MHQSLSAPRIPLYQLGYLGQEAGKIIGASAPVASAATGATLTAMTTLAVPVVGAIAAGAALLVGLIGGLLAAHALRAKQAKNENSAMNIGVAGFDTDLRKIQQAYTSGQIDANGAMQAVQVALQGYWTVVGPQIQPGRNDCQSGSACGAVTACSGATGAACCVGCVDLEYAVNGPAGVMAAIQGTAGGTGGPYTANIMAVVGSKYGGAARSAYTLSFKPPTAPAVPAGSLASELTSASAALTGGSGSSLLPLLLLAGLGFFLFQR